MQDSDGNGLFITKGATGCHEKTQKTQTKKVDEVSDGAAWQFFGGRTAAVILGKGIICYSNQITRFGSTPVTYDHGANAANPDPNMQARGNGNIADDGTRTYGSCQHSAQLSRAVSSIT